MDAWDPDPANSRFISKINRRKTWLIVAAVILSVLIVAGIVTMIVLLNKHTDNPATTVDFKTAQAVTMTPLTVTPPLVHFQTERLTIFFNYGYQSPNNSFDEVTLQTQNSKISNNFLALLCAC